MRKLKLEVQLSIDGFAADTKGKTDWMVWDWKREWNWDKELQQYHTDLQLNRIRSCWVGKWPSPGQSAVD